MILDSTLLYFTSVLFIVKLTHKIIISTEIFNVLIFAKPDEPNNSI